ncbi:MAG: LURP-one-related family protein [Lachnospiraceae bacterium]|nr:LURP-one-related family protein [Lachnospiraceae bacterium]
MKLYIKQKVFSIGAKFNITDEYGEERYSVEGEIFTLGKKLHIYDQSGEEVALIQQKLLSIMPRFYIFVNGEKIAEILKEFTFLKPRYDIFGKNWIVEGDFLSHDYSITENGNEIASVHKVWMSWGDSFELSIYDTNDEVGLIAVILAIDAVMDSNSNSYGSA